MTNTTLGKEGLGQQPWWVVEWMELINSYRYKKRLEPCLDLRPRGQRALDSF